MKEIILTPECDLQEALDQAPEGSRVLLSEGVYRQKVMLRTEGLVLEGAGAGKTVLVFDDYARKKAEWGRDLNTFRTYTLAVCADHVRMRNLSVVNAAGTPSVKGQEIALSVLGDDFEMEDCTLTSTQDTLFLGPLPPDLIDRYELFLPKELRRPDAMTQTFRHCRIEGTVDFIFGCGQALFEDCEIRSLTDEREIGYTAAPSHMKSLSHGFVFRRCRFTCEETVPAGSVYLARPWRDYGMCEFENCSYEGHIAPAGFDPWKGTRRDLTARFYETPLQPGRVSWARAYSPS